MKKDKIIKFLFVIIMLVVIVIAAVYISKLSKTSVVTIFAIGSAPFAMPHHKAIYPAFRPITSITLTRSWEVEVSRILSIASMAVFTAVSNPMV